MKKVIKWITREELENTFERKQTLAGTWVDCPLYKEADFSQDYEDAIIKEIVDNDYIICGDTHQYLCLPVFEDNSYIELSMRRWAELMAQAFNLANNWENCDKYTDFYIASASIYHETLPGEEKSGIKE